MPCVPLGGRCVDGRRLLLAHHHCGVSDQLVLFAGACTDARMRSRQLVSRTSAQPLIRVVLGVVSGMPQYVWSRHHSYHHAHNGNWDKYRGLHTTLSVDEYAAMTELRRRLYRHKCSIAFAPFAGLIYVIFNPRFTWLKGSIGLVSHVIKRKITQPHLSMTAHAASFETRYWRSHKEYWHMFWNNVALLSVWGLMCWGIGTALFFSIYLSSAALAGGAGVILFTVQHNFQHSYASDSKQWDYDTGAIEGTSFLILPPWLNWFTANIAYHHIHHLSAKIPHYQLVKCHNENRHLFLDVTRVTLSHIPSALKYILWDTRSRRIISVAEYQQQMIQHAVVNLEQSTVQRSGIENV